MNNLDRYADTMLGQINQCISQQLESTPAIRSAIVKNVNTDGTVDVIIPPNDTSVFTKITNQTPFTLNEGDSVELLLKSGNLNNCWVIAKHNAEQTTAWTDMRSHVGMIIQSTTLDSEAKVIQLYGGKHWRRIVGRFLMGADEDHTVGTEIEPGLPNITGSLSGVDGAGNCAYTWGFKNGSNGFVQVDQNGVTYNKYGGAYTMNYGTTANFDASRSSSIYGNSNTVQPASFVVYMWERTQ